MSDPDDPAGAHSTSRRALLVGSAASLSALHLFKQAYNMELARPAVKRGYSHRNDPDDADVRRYPGVHQGKGAIDVKFFFRDEGAPKPALLLIYDIPPGASEGVHTPYCPIFRTTLFWIGDTTISASGGL